MPVITEQNGVKTVKGLPDRWGRKAYAELKAARGDAIGHVSQQYKDISAMLDAITGGALPVDATDSNLCILAETYANDCASFSARITDPAALAQKMAEICSLRGIVAPDFDNPSQIIYRCTDAAWWRRKMRKTHGRSREHAAIRLGFVSTQTGKYCSDETAQCRVSQNRRNAATLGATTMTNTETDQSFSLADLAAKGTGNKRIRRGELMMRLAGCAELAIEYGHVGIFVTLTTPSKFHAVLEKSGAPNPKYNGATPLQAHQHLTAVWALTRAQNGRDGIAPYGFRIAEPHHDGCTHWHMLVFMPKNDALIFMMNLADYAMEEDGEEAGAEASRVKFDIMDRTKGGAAGYLAKYVAKNIGDNDAEEDLFGKTIITKEMRVDAWAGVWGIRQFQPMGQPPVTVWREMRRVEADKVAGDLVPEHVKAAHAACQRVLSETETDEAGKPMVIHAANWHEYLTAQGGVNRGKNYLIGLCAPVVMIEGRYGLIEAPKSIGIYCKEEPEVIYQSTRYTWKKSGGAVRFCSPWSPVNNCTEAIEPPWAKAARQPQEIADFDFEDWYYSFEAGEFILYPEEVEAFTAEAKAAAKIQRTNTVWTEPKRGNYA